ncbi:hypothetical protein BZK37_03330, partial [Enterococcus casseliflavus]
MGYKYRGKRNTPLYEEKRQPKYGIRKLSIGVVSCFLGCAIYFGPTVTAHAEESTLTADTAVNTNIAEPLPADDDTESKDRLSEETIEENNSNIDLPESYTTESNVDQASEYLLDEGDNKENIVIHDSESTVAEATEIESDAVVEANSNNQNISDTVESREEKPIRSKREVTEYSIDEAEDTSTWKPDDIEDNSDAVTISESGTSGWSSIGWRSGTKEVFYKESTDNGLGANFGWSSKPGGNDNYADELIRIHAEQDGDVIHWRVVIKGENSGKYKGLTRDLQRPYFLFTVSRGLGQPENIVVKNYEDKPLEDYSSNWNELPNGNSRARKIYNPESVEVNGKEYNLLGSGSHVMKELTGGYRLGNTGDNEAGKNYNIEKYTYYSKYTFEDWQSGHAEPGSTRQYYFDTKILWDEIAELGNVPNVDSEFSDWMGWGKQRTDVDLTDKVWVIGAVTSREGTNGAQTPNGAGIYNFSKIALLEPAPADTTPPSPPTVVAKEDGSVTVTPPTEPDTETVTVTYTPEGGDKETTVTVDK